MASSTAENGWNGHATKTKSAFRMEYAGTVNINANVDRVWALMTNAEGFPRWNSTIKHIEGQIAAGQTIKLIATVAPSRVFNLNIIDFVPKSRMVWSDGNAMFKGMRTYSVASKPNGSTDFSMAEVYTGLMLPVKVARSRGHRRIASGFHPNL